MLLLAGLVAGCGGAVAPPPPPPSPATAAGTGDGCVLAGGDPASSRAPVAAAGEGDTALLSPLRARTPIGLDCTGRPVPRAATAWSPDSSRTGWTLVLAEPSRAAAAWREPEARAALRLGGATSVVPLDAQRIVVSFREPQDTVPAVFADPVLALPQPAESLPSIQVISTGDLRDALDRGADLVLTADPAVLEYAGTLPEYAPHPLPWSRTYVLIVPDSPAALELAVPDTAAFRDGLAREAVRGAARGAEPPFWWERATRCERAPGPGEESPRVVLYPASDGVARALAERIVALSGTPGLVARAAAAWELPAAMARGAAAGFVVPLPRTPTLPCREVGTWPTGAKVLALIDTRLTAVVREGAPPVRVDHDGGILPAGTR